MSLPGFAAENALGATRGTYRGRHAAAPAALVVPQLPIGPIGEGLGTCCCVSFNWGVFNNAVARQGRQVLPAWGTAAVTAVTPAFSWGPIQVECTECPHGADGDDSSDCNCSCNGGSPCAQRDNVTVCN
jgi:hypothetical protein